MNTVNQLKIRTDETTQGEEEAVLEGDEPGGEAAEAETAQSVEEAVGSDAGRSGTRRTQPRD